MKKSEVQNILNDLNRLHELGEHLDYHHKLRITMVSDYEIVGKDNSELYDDIINVLRAYRIKQEKKLEALGIEIDI